MKKCIPTCEKCTTLLIYIFKIFAQHYTLINIVSTNAWKNDIAIALQLYIRDKYTHTYIVYIKFNIR